MRAPSPTASSAAAIAPRASPMPWIAQRLGQRARRRSGADGASHRGPGTPAAACGRARAARARRCGAPSSASVPPAIGCEPGDGAQQRRSCPSRIRRRCRTPRPPRRANETPRDDRAAAEAHDEIARLDHGVEPRAAPPGGGAYRDAAPRRARRRRSSRRSRPASITSTRSQNPATRSRSWLMKMSPMPRRATRSSSTRQHLLRRRWRRAPRSARRRSAGRGRRPASSRSSRAAPCRPRPGADRARRRAPARASRTASSSAERRARAPRARASRRCSAERLVDLRADASSPG